MSSLAGDSDGVPVRSPLRSAVAWALPVLAHAAVVGWVFAGALFRGQLLFFRDISVYYYPNYAFLERSLAQGVWPLWNPTSEAGAPFLITDPLDLMLVRALGADGALRFGPPLHLLIAMVGCTVLARCLGMGRWGEWTAGLFYGLSGYVLSAVNLFELFHAVAWAPWVMSAALGLWATPGRRSVAAFAALAAIQTATLGAEIVVQTGLAGLALFTHRPSRRRCLALGGGLGLSLLLAAPVLLGIRAVVEGTRRAEGLTWRESFGWSAHPVVLMDAVLPGFFGNVHTFSETGYWGQPFFPDGFPYFLSLYVGPGVLLLAVLAGPLPVKTRLWALVVLGSLIALGAHGPLAPLLPSFMRHFRTPPKFLFMSTLSLCLLAGSGLDHALRSGRRLSLLVLLTGTLLVAVSTVLYRAPELPGRIFGSVLPEILDPRARFVVASAWPVSLGTTGALLIGAALALWSASLRPLAGVLIGLDLVIVNGPLNEFTDPAFYRLHPPLASLVAEAKAEGAHRWFSYGAAGTPGLAWAPQIAWRNRDVWLYYVDRQSIRPRMHVLDGLEAAFDEDHVGWAPPGSTLISGERIPSRYREHHARLRLASVRWVLSFRPLPDDLVRLRGQAVLPETLEPLRLYEILDPLDRAFWVGRHEVASDRASLQRRLVEFDPRAEVLLEREPPATSGAETGTNASDGRVDWDRLDAHTVRLQVAGPPGFVVVSEGFHRDWHVETTGEARPLLRANGRYWAIPTAGGAETLIVRYRPAWRTLALLSWGLGAIGVIALAGWPRKK